MAIETHSVTADDVVDDLPFAAGSTVTSTSDGLSTGLIEAWIKRAAGSVNATLAGRGLDPSTLGEDLEQTARSAIIAWCRAKALDKRGFSEDDSGSAWQEYRELKGVLSGSDVELGEDFDEEGAVQSNVDTTSDKQGPTFGAEEFGTW